jgi:hypothetical protein
MILRKLSLPAYEQRYIPFNSTTELLIPVITKSAFLFPGVCANKSSFNKIMGRTIINNRPTHL